tara:strand:- start:4469 stop:4633 length:165 start_codon:yes stop_codon:yes gene_type:complete
MKKKTKVFGKKKAKKDIPFEPKPYYYTQRDWDRVVGWGKVPKEYQYPGMDYSDK